MYTSQPYEHKFGTRTDKTKMAMGVGGGGGGDRSTGKYLCAIFTTDYEKKRKEKSQSPQHNNYSDHF